MVHKPLRLVISDIGDVYVRWHGVISRICQIYGLPKEEFTSWYLNGFATMLYEGILPIEEFWKTVNITYHVNVTGDPFTTYFDGTPIKGMERVFKALKAHGIRLVSASNTYAPNWDVCFRYADMSVFSAHYPSHLLHLAKPSQDGTLNGTKLPVSTGMLKSAVFIVNSTSSVYLVADFLRTPETFLRPQIKVSAKYVKCKSQQMYEAPFCLFTLSDARGLPRTHSKSIVV